jgi:hypothetical protein
LARAFAWTLAVLAPALVPTLVRAEGEAALATVPYKVLYDTLKPVLAAQGLSRLRVRPHITSHGVGVRPESIRMVVQAKSGARTINVGADGNLEFPLEDGLLAENPLVSTNQPKGSLTMGVTLELVVPAGGHWACADVLAGLGDADKVIAASAQQPAPGKVGGLELFFAPAAHATVTVKGKTERLLVADEDGRVELRRDAEIAEPGAALEFSVRPQRAQPLLVR